MNVKRKKYIQLTIWILMLTLIGSAMGSVTNNGIDTWYHTLNRSVLTPPDYMFGVAWSILYTMIAVCGWCIWGAKPCKDLRLIKGLYIFQLILNWMWTPLFFGYHLTGLAFICLTVMVVVVATLVWKTYKKLLSAALLLTPYLLWLLIAGYLNFYMWLYN